MIKRQDERVRGEKIELIANIMVFFFHGFMEYIKMVHNNVYSLCYCLINLFEVIIF